MIKKDFLFIIKFYCNYLIILILLHCTNSNPAVSSKSYEPPVVFKGFINGNEMSLSGNFYWPNRCTLKNDTVRMYFYSDDFSESNKIRHGDLMRIDFYPNSDTMIGIRNVLFHLARYYDRNSSYNISPKDSMDLNKKVQMHRVALSASREKRVNIDEIFLRTPALNGTSGIQLEISKGTITGVVEK